MNAYSVIRKGEDHPVFCEDFMSINNSGRYFIGVVFDGCSSGSDSHFASSLFGKIFNQITNDEVVFGNTIEERAKNLIQKFVN